MSAVISRIVAAKPLGSATRELRFGAGASCWQAANTARKAKANAGLLMVVTFSRSFGGGLAMSF
jgi:hypothetical protein